MEADSVERRQEELGIHILENIRNELYYYFPYLDGAFACISGKGSEQTRTIGTDGAFFLFSPEYLLKLYDEHEKNDMNKIEKLKLQNRAYRYQHSVKKLLRY